jgi:hypothetical protein
MTDMNTEQVFTKKEENEILRELHRSGDITLQEFLEFSDLSFSQKLLEQVRERAKTSRLQSSEWP